MSKITKVCTIYQALYYWHLSILTNIIKTWQKIGVKIFDFILIKYLIKMIKYKIIIMIRSKPHRSGLEIIFSGSELLFCSLELIFCGSLTENICSLTHHLGFQTINLGFWTPNFRLQNLYGILQNLSEVFWDLSRIVF